MTHDVSGSRTVVVESAKRVTHKYPDMALSVMSRGSPSLVSLLLSPKDRATRRSSPRVTVAYLCQEPLSLSSANATYTHLHTPRRRTSNLVPHSERRSSEAHHFATRTHTPCCQTRPMLPALQPLSARAACTLPSSAVEERLSRGIGHTLSARRYPPRASTARCGRGRPRRDTIAGTRTSTSSARRSGRRQSSSRTAGRAAPTSG